METIIATTTTNTNRTKENHTIATDILDDLASRFIINIPDSDRSNFVRICFQIELAHWFYLDFYCGEENRTLVPCGIKQFASHIFNVSNSVLYINFTNLLYCIEIVDA